jgi:hypothetical protein
MDIMRTHPMVIIGGILQENPFFVPHHGHSSRGMGDGLRSSFLKAIVRARAE